MIQSPRSVLVENARVANLIDQDTKSWKTQLLNTIFHPYEAKVVQGIPLSPMLVPDKLSPIWRCTSNGIFSVRSAYHLEMECNARNGGEASGKSNTKHIWKICWQLQISNVVKLFLW
jgi:hypothetical protein